MKKLTLTILLSTSLILGCKKNNDTSIDENLAKHPVTFSVKKFSQTVVPLEKSSSSISNVADSLRKHADFLYCIIYPQNSFLQQYYFEQNRESADFGTIKTNLPAGEYYVRFVASKRRLRLIGDRRFQTSYMDRGTTPEPWGEVFFLDYYTLNVSQNSTNYHDVTLTRMTGAVEVKLTDVIPKCCKNRFRKLC